MKTTAATIIRAIQEAVDAAERRGVDVSVTIEEHGFFPSESSIVTVTATKPRATPDKAKSHYG